jgi:tetratricopeptide (TPR) repeat protein
MISSGDRADRTRAADFTTPLTIPGGAAAGADVVRELPPELVLPVWQTLRSVLIWAAEEPALRGDLFEPCAMADWERALLQDTWEPELRSPLVVLVGELAIPMEASPETIARACLCVTEWALGQDHVTTALAFAEAAALAWPQHSRFSWLAGGLLRRHGRLREAEQWLRRAARAAASTMDWESQTLARHSLGNVLRELGRNPQAARALGDALRVARRHKLRPLEGEILHDLFIVASLSGQGGDEYAQSAFDIYRDGHPRLPAFAHDVASIWLLRGCHAQALTVLEHLPPLIELPEERIKVWASLAWAAAECGESGTYREAADEVWMLLSDPDVPHSASALLELAVGATRMRAWDEAEQAVTEAVGIAARNGDSALPIRAEEVRVMIRNRVTSGDDEAGAPELQDTQQANAFVSGLLASLTGRVPSPV